MPVDCTNIKPLPENSVKCREDNIAREISSHFDGSSLVIESNGANPPRAFLHCPIDIAPGLVNCYSPFFAERAFDACFEREFNQLTPVHGVVFKIETYMRLMWTELEKKLPEIIGPIFHQSFPNWYFLPDGGKVDVGKETFTITLVARREKQPKAV